MNFLNATMNKPTVALKLIYLLINMLCDNRVAYHWRQDKDLRGL